MGENENKGLFCWLCLKKIKGNVGKSTELGANSEVEKEPESSSHDPNNAEGASSEHESDTEVDKRKYSLEVVIRSTTMCAADIL